MTMDILIAATFLALLSIRLFTLSISIKNERVLKESGAKEYGKLNSKILMGMHVLFYIGSFSESVIKNIKFDNLALLGIGVYLFSMLALYMVIKDLGRLWTAKLILAKGHSLKKTAIFKYFRHPNYFLNVIPELISVALIFKSWYVFVVLFPIYLVSLVIRIAQEEKIMRQHFKYY